MSQEPENHADLIAEVIRLRESEARLRGLFEHCQEGFVLGEPITRPDGKRDFRYLEVNQAWEDLVGIPRAAVIGRTVREVLPDIADEWFLFLSETMEAGTPLQFSRHLVAANRWIDVTMFQPCEGVIAIFFRDITDRKHAFDQLRESEENYKHTVELHPQATWTATPDGAIERVSARWFEWTGRSGTGETWIEGLHPDDRQRAVDAWRVSLSKCEPLDIHYRAIMRDGIYRWLHSRAYPRRDQLGNVIKWYGTTEDVHDRYLVEEKLREVNASLEERIRKAVADRERFWTKSRDMQVIVTTDGRVQAASPAVKHVLGYEEVEVLGDYMKFVHPEDRQRAAAALMMGHDGIHGVEVRHIAKNGEIRYISWVASAPTDGLVYGSGRDVTAEKMAERAAQEAEARARAVFESSFHYQGYMTPEGILTESNSESLRSIDAQEEDVVGKPFWEAPWFDENPEIAEQVKEAIREVARGATYRREVVMKLPIGRRIFDFSLRPVRDAAGTVIGIIPEAMDLTDWKDAQEQIAHKMKVESLGQLTGGIAHDFNNLLTPIIGALETLKRRANADERAERMASAGLRAAEKARTLIQKLLTFSRRQHLKSASVDVRALVNGLVEMLVPSMGPGIDYVTDIPDDIPPVKVDPNQFELALMNLAINARDAMGGSGALVLSCRQQIIETHLKLRPGPYVAISVTDYGRGMDAETQRRAIEPFFTTKGVGQGTGLGLSMVYGLAIQSGGYFELQSEPGVGTTATIYLPASMRPAEIQHSEEAPPLGAERLGSVLLVDDEELARAGAADMLRELGYNVVEARSGKEALDLLDAGFKPDLLVTDYAMPGMSGAELVNRVRSTFPDMPVLMVTGYAELAEEVAAGYPRLSKPFRLMELASSLRSAANAVLH